MIARKAPAEGAGGTGTQRWVPSALDCRAHLLSDLPRGGDWLWARCGAVLPMTTYRHDYQPTGPLACTECARIATPVPGRSSVEPPHAPGDRPVPPPDPAGEIEVLAELLAAVAGFTASGAVYPGQLASIAEQAQRHPNVRRALRGEP